MEELVNYIKPEILAFAPVIYAIGVFLKKMDWFKDKFIPLALAIICVILSCGWCIGFEGLSLESFGVGFVQGILLASVTVFSNQVYKQVTKEE